MCGTFEVLCLGHVLLEECGTTLAEDCRGFEGMLSYLKFFMYRLVACFRASLKFGFRKNLLNP